MMQLFFKLAWRNVFRNRVRTLVSVLAIASGTAALVLNAGIILNIFGELREDAIHGRLGHLQVYRSGYSDHHLEDPLAYRIAPAESDLILQLARTNSRVRRATRRSEFSGLISNGDRRASFLGVAVDPQDDPEFSGHTTLREGAAMAADRPYGVLAGFGLAQKLQAHPGDGLIIMTTTASDVLNAVHVKLLGVFEGGLKEFDDWALKVPRATAAQLLLDESDEQIVLLLNRTEDLAAARLELEDEFRRAGLNLETRAWSELALFHNQVVGLFGRELGIIRLIVAAIVILGIGNAIGMSIMERSVELATLRALGINARAVTALLTLEALLTGVLGATLGILGAVAFARVVNEIGIAYPSPPGSTRPFQGGIDVAPAVLAEAFAVSLTASLLAAAFPIWRTIRQPIALALRHA